jgi:hypothetical protein
MRDEIGSVATPFLDRPNLDLRRRRHGIGAALSPGYGFLDAGQLPDPTEPDAEVGAIHPKAMPVIFTTPDEVECWLTAPPDKALKLQRPLPDGTLQVVTRGVKEDPPGPVS